MTHGHRLVVLVGVERVVLHDGILFLVRDVIIFSIFYIYEFSEVEYWVTLVFDQILGLLVVDNQQDFFVAHLGDLHQLAQDAKLSLIEGVGSRLFVLNSLIERYFTVAHIDLYYIEINY